jgi:hypothetical protein
MPMYLALHSAPGLAPDEIAQNTALVLESKHAAFQQFFVNMREGFIASVYEADDASQVEREFERIGFPWTEIHEITFHADAAKLRAMVPAP